MKKITIIYVALVFAVLAITSCQFLKEVATTVNNVQRLKYKINTVNNFTMGGMDISNKKTASDFSVSDGLKLAMAVKSGQLPTSFTINVDALNPNDGTNNTIQTAATIAALPWDLYIDNKLIISGGEIAGTHIVYFDSSADTIELTHRAKNSCLLYTSEAETVLTEFLLNSIQ